MSAYGESTRPIRVPVLDLTDQLDRLHSATQLLARPRVNESALTFRFRGGYPPLRCALSETPLHLMKSTAIRSER